MTDALRIMLIVGEPSGDALGAQLMKALRDMGPHGLSFEGVGGAAMTREGLTSLFSISDTSVMGLSEVVPKIPLILRRVREAAAYAMDRRPDLVILIDSPDFTHRIARRLKRLAPEIPIVKYVAPQVWATRPGRAKKLAEFVDHLLAILPFEPAFFERYGLATHFVGHPALERSAPPKPGELEGFRARHGLKPETPLLVLLPGSRSNEIRYILPVFLETVDKLIAALPELRIVLPTVPHVRERVAAAIAQAPGPITLIEDEAEKLLSFRAATAALAASGTVSTELALAGAPMVIGYRLGWLTALLTRSLLQVRYMTLVNLVLEREVIPEFMQERCTSGNLFAALWPLLTSPQARAEQVSLATPALAKMGAGAEAPSRRAARTILEICGSKRLSGGG
jgi:lipid-A-disaccharide synthase